MAKFNTREIGKRTVMTVKVPLTAKYLKKALMKNIITSRKSFLKHIGLNTKVLSVKGSIMEKESYT